MENLRQADYFESEQDYDIISYEQVENYLRALKFDETKIQNYLAKINSQQVNAKDMIFWTEVLSAKMKYFYQNRALYSEQDFEKIKNMVETLGDILATIRQQNINF